LPPVILAAAILLDFRITVGARDSLYSIGGRGAQSGEDAVLRRGVFDDVAEIG